MTLVQIHSVKDLAFEMSRIFSKASHYTEKLYSHELILSKPMLLIRHLKLTFICENVSIKSDFKWNLRSTVAGRMGDDRVPGKYKKPQKLKTGPV